MLVGLGIFAGNQYLNFWKDNKRKIKDWLRSANLTEELYADGLSLASGFAGEDSFIAYCSKGDGPVN